MKTLKTILAVAVLAASTNSLANQNPVACFEREWMIVASSERQPTMTLEQLAQAIPFQMPFLQVKSLDGKLLIVEYKQIGATPSSDVPNLRQAFTILTQHVGLLVECNRTAEPFPSMTGQN